MGFCAPPIPNFGFLDTGCSVLGGIKIDPSVQDAGFSCSSKDFYVSQYNLAYHWRRPHMVPHSVGFPQLLTRTISWLHGSVALRQTGHWPFETHRNRLMNRNLLAVMENPADDSVRLWSVSELSTRKRLLEFRLCRRKEEEFDEWVVADRINEDQENNYDYGRTTVAQRSLNASWDDEIQDISREQMHLAADYRERRYFRMLDLKTALLELRSWKPAGERCQVLARSEDELYLCDPENGTVLTLFQNPVHSLSFIPNMSNEIVFLDDCGLIWYGEVGENFVRVKCGYDIQSVAGSDHPRVIYAAGKDSVRLIDLRVGTSNGDLLYAVPDYDDTSRNSYHFQYKGAFEKPTINQLYSLLDVPQMLLVCTSKKFVLVDERMRGLICLDMAHSIHDGGHYVANAAPIPDPVRNGTIYPVCILQHTVHPDVQTFSLYRHSDSTQWSALASICRLQEPRDAAAFYRQQPKYNIRISRHDEKQLFGRGPTRAVSFLNLNSGNPMPFLFRMMDDGSLWYEQISVQDDRELKEKMLWREAGKIKDIIDGSDFDGEKFCSVLPGNVLQKVKVFDVQMDVDNAANLYLGDGIEALQPLDTCPESGYPEPKIIENITDEQLLSKTVLHCWEKYSY